MDLLKGIQVQEVYGSAGLAHPEQMSMRALRDKTRRRINGESVMADGTRAVMEL